MENYLVKFTTKEDSLHNLVMFRAEDADNAIKQLEAYLVDSKPVLVEVYKCSLVLVSSPVKRLDFSSSDPITYPHETLENHRGS